MELGSQKNFEFWIQSLVESFLKLRQTQN